MYPTEPISVILPNAFVSLFCFVNKSEPAIMVFSHSFSLYTPPPTPVSLSVHLPRSQPQLNLNLNLNNTLLTRLTYLSTRLGLFQSFQSTLAMKLRVPSLTCLYSFKFTLSPSISSPPCLHLHQNEEPLSRTSN